MNKYLLDTNILIYYFNGEEIVRPIFVDILADKTVGYYCPLTWVELLCYASLSESEANKMRIFLRRLISVALTETILDGAAEIRRNFRLKLPDALIAACAIQEDCTLVTRNTKDFQNILGLKVWNPFVS
ncbi:MAG: type II toxin-antitoxin system VapC family toxin [Okeania sp. SIO3I5]|uniref:type II toxin-antitoxin system VapC family toxin n=1 Tax=Okeania sp. SIO3I5 TaxID=2607805 RepID=UPI0013BB7C71|nr:type II toxin-antitoxin system VapC family toxin [Okeania sp. SIO3I5]NEQ37305.1 type II toxin-antitoxin system VapC family toxin [Okeania sp. SIO3I5]